MVNDTPITTPAPKAEDKAEKLAAETVEKGERRIPVGQTHQNPNGLTVAKADAPGVASESPPRLTADEFLIKYSKERNGFTIPELMDAYVAYHNG